MKQVNRDHYDARDPIRSIYEGGLKSAFAACHDPLPEKMEKILQQLRERASRPNKRGPAKRGQSEMPSN
jgi:hypothetical protein